MATERKRPAEATEGLMTGGVQPIKEEKLTPGEPLDEVDLEEEAAPAYRREELGPRLQDHALNAAENTGSVEELKEQLDNDDSVPLLFPVKVSLQDKGLMHHWAPGVHLVPASLAGHWWLKHNKVRKAGAVIKKSA